MAAHADIEATQRAVLGRLLRKGARTLWGREHRFDAVGSYGEYVEAQAVTPYEEIRPLVMRMIAGESSILWPGVTRRFAQSSGTSGGKSKYIPVTADSLRLNHFRGGSDAVAHYLAAHPDSRLFDGRAFILGGSFASTLPAPPPAGVRVGDLSANLIDAIPPLAAAVRVPSKQIALMEQWSEKLPALARAAAARTDITNISGVPSWFLTVLKEVLALTGKESVKQVWPRLEVFFHGGISMSPYRDSYRDIIGTPGIDYLETYNASEGFFGVQDDPAVPAMSLMLDAGVFYEFEDTDTGTIYPAWQLTQGKVYALIITAANGLWRYPIGDTVLVHSISPLRITIAGRTKSYINAFGEELMVHNADAAIARACAATGATVADYTAAPMVATTSGRANGYHDWLIEFVNEPADIEAFADILDRALRTVNSDYDAKRTDDIFLTRLHLRSLPPGSFNRWLAATGRLGGQRKVPRLSNDRTTFDDILRTISLHES